MKGLFFPFFPLGLRRVILLGLPGKDRVELNSTTGRSSFVSHSDSIDRFRGGKCLPLWRRPDTRWTFQSRPGRWRAACAGWPSSRCARAAANQSSTSLPSFYRVLSSTAPAQSGSLMPHWNLCATIAGNQFNSDHFMFHMKIKVQRIQC